MTRTSSPWSPKKPVKRRGAFLLVATFFLLLLIPPPMAGAEKTVPFSPGEELVFQANWGPIPAGKAVLRVLPMEKVKGITSYHFELTARTFPVIDIFYKVRDRIDAYTDLKMTRSILYKKQKQGRSKKRVVVDFHWDRKEAQYSNFGKKRKPISLLPGAFDPLSVFYAFRLQPLRVDKEMAAPVTDGKKCVIGRVKVIRRERIEVPSGVFDTFLVEPELEHIGGVFEKSKDAKLQVWVTADSRRIPVKVKSKVIVGSFVGELLSISTPLSSASARRGP